MLGALGSSGALEVIDISLRLVTDPWLLVKEHWTRYIDYLTATTILYSVSHLKARWYVPVERNEHSCTLPNDLRSQKMCLSCAS